MSDRREGEAVVPQWLPDSISDFECRTVLMQTKSFEVCTLNALTKFSRAQFDVVPIHAVVKKMGEACTATLSDVNENVSIAV